MNQQIDVVIPWVDGNDEIWRESFNVHVKKNSDYQFDKEKAPYQNLSFRYRDWGLLRYWFRGIEENMPWVNKIHFVTQGHLPNWLNIHHPKLHIVLHSDFIPDDFLPTFSSHGIEVFLHKIPTLSENFIYFNDDMFIIDKMNPTDFFVNNVPCDVFALKFIELCFEGVPHINVNHNSMINRTFIKRNVMRRNFFKLFNLKYGLLNNIDNFTHLLLPMYRGWRQFNGFFDHHLPQPFKRKIFEEVWKHAENELLRTARNKFRRNTDVHQYIFRYWQLCTGAFHPKDTFNKGKFYHTNKNTLNDIDQTIVGKKMSMVAINDGQDCDFNNCTTKVKKSFEKRFPNKSLFEL